MTTAQNGDASHNAPRVPLRPQTLNQKLSIKPKKANVAPPVRALKQSTLSFAKIPRPKFEERVRKDAQEPPTRSALPCPITPSPSPGRCHVKLHVRPAQFLCDILEYMDHATQCSDLTHHAGLMEAMQSWLSKKETISEQNPCCEAHYPRKMNEKNSFTVYKYWRDMSEVLPRHVHV